MFVCSCAASTTNAAKMMTAVPPIFVTSTTGSHSGLPKITIVALVTATPMKANAVIVVGNPIAWPSICDFWLRA